MQCCTFLVYSSHLVSHRSRKSSRQRLCFSVPVNGPRRRVESISIGVGPLIGVEIGTCIVLDVGSDVTDAYSALIEVEAIVDALSVARIVDCHIVQVD